MDADEDGEIRRAEVQAAALRFGRFDDFDANADGRLTMDEVQRHRTRQIPRRRMAHDRTPPPGYVDGFRPNMFLRSTGLECEAREVPLTDYDIRQHERRFREKASRRREDG